jgi:CDGSH iron-sulfur domain-containing protein 3
LRGRKGGKARGRPMAEPERPQLSPYQVELEAGKRYAWCRCGRSKKQPFCDGSHAGTGIEPLMFTAERNELALLCGCKDTGDPPYCDGSHMLL